MPHRAARLLSHLRRRGASVLTSTTPWGVARCDNAILRGPHKLAHDERAFVFEEILDFCAQGYWAVLPYTAVRISPLWMVPRLIVDYTFSGVNDATVPLAPKESMQFGRALQRVMSNIVGAETRYGPVFLSKIDIADGFYRVWLQATGIPKLGFTLPTTPGQPFLVAFPLALPMGWVESPPISRHSRKQRVTWRITLCAHAASSAHATIQHIGSNRWLPHRRRFPQRAPYSSSGARSKRTIVYGGV